ncbi:hypothetical protein JCM10213v2_008974 [Rhodosporidiobolus nylandii]
MSTSASNAVVALSTSSRPDLEDDARKSETGLTAAGRWMLPLPAELVDMVLSSPELSPADLAHCAAACRALRPVALHHLYHNVNLEPDAVCEEAWFLPSAEEVAWIQHLASSPAAGALVKKFTYDPGLDLISDAVDEWARRLPPCETDEPEPEDSDDDVGLIDRDPEKYDRACALLDQHHVEELPLVSELLPSLTHLTHLTFHPHRQMMLDILEEHMKDGLFFHLVHLDLPTFITPFAMYTPLLRSYTFSSFPISSSLDPYPFTQRVVPRAPPPSLSAVQIRNAYSKEWITTLTWLLSQSHTSLHTLDTPWLLLNPPVLPSLSALASLTLFPEEAIMSQQYDSPAGPPMFSSFPSSLTRLAVDTVGGNSPWTAPVIEAIFRNPPPSLSALCLLNAVFSPLTLISAINNGDMPHLAALEVEEPRRQYDKANLAKYRWTVVTRAGLMRACEARGVKLELRKNRWDLWWGVEEDEEE